MTQKEASELYRTDYHAWLNWKLAQPGQYATEAEAKIAAQSEMDARTRDNFQYGVSRNRNGGWDVAMYSSDD